MSVVIAYGPCGACKNPFSFDPGSVPSLPIDPVTGLPPDMGGDPERAIRQPICPSCCARANVGRRKAGQPLWDETDSMDRLTHKEG